MIPILILSVLVFISGGITILAQYRQSKPLEYRFKPLTMVFVILIALLAPHRVSTSYQVAIVLGLLASMAGDVFLMLPSDKFVPGLVSFLFAHLLYIAAFTLDGHGAAPLWTVLPFVVYGALMVRWLWPFLGTMKGPVLVYMGVILIMAWQAANRWLQTDQTHTLLALVGAYLFVASDSVLAVERFRGSFRSAAFWVLGLYFAAQWLIALSISTGF